VEKISCEVCKNTDETDPKTRVEHINMLGSMAYKEITKAFCSICKIWYTAKTKIIDLSGYRSGSNGDAEL